MSTYRDQKTATQRFTTISTDRGPYELWNSLTSEEENVVIEKLGLEKGGLPLSKKDKETQRLLFGKGAFGKVRLAQKDGILFAVKKIILGFWDNVDDIVKEHNFGLLLYEKRIPHVVHSVDGAISTNKRGQKTLYLFLDKVASLGDGHNLKKLLSYFGSKEQRDEILKHTAYSLLEAVASLHQNQMYHRDIKASNVLISSTGQIYLSDFGAATTSNAALISAVLNENIPEYTVSNQSDARYFSPEFHVAVTFKESVPATDPYAVLDNWRLGLTLLQLCGVIKENEGLLARNYDSSNEDGSITVGWLDELKRRGEVTREGIQSYFAEQIQKVKMESMDKIPVELREIIFGLLEPDFNKRLTAAEALKMLRQAAPINPSLVQAGFKNLVHNQIAETVKSSIKKALKAEAQRTQGLWLNDALREFRQLLKQPGITFERLENFLDKWILEKDYQPTISREQYQVTLSLVQQKHGLFKPTLTSPISVAPKIEDPEFVRLQANFRLAANQLLDYVKTKIGKQSQSFKELEQHTMRGLNSLIDRFRKFISPKELEITRVESKLREGSFDESAVKAVFARTGQIVSQLTIGKLMSLNKEELTAVSRMLKKDKAFLESIEDKIPERIVLENPLKQINEKIQLVEQIENDNSIYISNNKLDTKQFLNYERQAKAYCASHTESEAKFVFSEYENIKAYQLPSSTSSELFRDFVVLTMQDTSRLKELYLYTSSGKIGNSIANTLRNLSKNLNLKIYINDQLISKKRIDTKFAQFFRESQSAKLEDLVSKFTIEELSSQDVAKKISKMDN